MTDTSRRADILRDFHVPPEALAAAPPARRDDVRLLVGRQGTGEVGHHAFRDLPGLLQAGDVLVVNTSRTLPSAVDGQLGGDPVVAHFSTRRDDGRWVVEIRDPDGRGSTVRRAGGPAGAVVQLTGGGKLTLDEPMDPCGDRLWIASPSTPDMVSHLRQYGRPIRYAYTDRDQPLSAYQTVFATPSPDGGGSAEMPSAARPFTAPLVTELVSRGVQIAPIVLHTGVASAEAYEPPYAEPYSVPATTAWQVNAARAAGGRVIAVGTTAVRALETAADTRGVVRPAQGWTDLVITPERGVRAVDGLLTGLHEPEASHLLMLRAVSGDDLLERVYAEALQHRYLWHEFGDVNLLLP
ncbi:S-adenosylmethionine:tRNA ribosyltransferase-isomerase [Streptomyces cocklensis]|jgi:S-adenosylmethionine:tRNA ribosyltransferase-isomerase|uniref:S-adenosylmethionine:tRNA ribosyltransferase-isomerase n=1 Tax=Actinacidiphila cocklensis TaxID=887465 RepID=A0A9W4DPQ5_9ACTN|nr:S-adenosylmethionine:tRNA ribosyltransferase-isomerase [Actinacidiphila cocklensis]MDD1060618.1 S-adenosylmethionine:tRNA ribosyltransferase-isomerase [Actinacidiphila cocklensis]WSX73856.1 S-adenosylmethionine:tRNA ribosyltransferase-isomerase [Streptomyces sp. NBC_00899]WSX80079.1 S-adenosylmethionine:tRNA ribosyltransferase-isomerase [Streptomyces sp. NBC_00899]CAG6394033.1 S-adenosylmethionine:tRNA ribosyltransferase-isomerase [Actinacidiphila cocklensis]